MPARTAFVATLFGQVYILKTGGTDLATTNAQGQTEGSNAVDSDVEYIGSEIDYNTTATQQVITRTTILAAGDAIRFRIMNRSAGASDVTRLGVRALVSGDERAA